MKIDDLFIKEENKTPWTYYKGNFPFTGMVDEGEDKGYLDNGKREGPWKGYYESGGLRYKGSYKNNKRNGFWSEYYENGSLIDEGEYIDGEKEGKWVYYNENGTAFKGLTGIFVKGEKVSD
jgi:uncharacterized protein